MTADLYDKGFSYRLREAVKALELARGSDISQEELGALVGKAMGRAPFTGVAAHRWLKGRRPTYDVMRALAKVVRRSPGWLAFGEDGIGVDLVTKSTESAALTKAAAKFRGREQRQAEHGRRRGDRTG